MGTKLKNIATNSITKVIVWIIFLAFILLGARQTFSLLSETIENGYKLESVFVSDYVSSEQFRDDSQEVLDYLCMSLEYEGQVDTEGNYEYYMSKGDQVYTNISNPDVNSFTDSPYNVIYQYESDYPEVNESSILAQKGFYNKVSFGVYDEETGMHIVEEPVYIYFAFNEEWLNEQQLLWEESAEFFTEKAYFKNILITCIIAFLSALYLMIFAGRSPKQEGIKVYSFDKMYSEVGWAFLFALLISVILIFAGIIALELESLTNSNLQGTWDINGFASILVAICMGLILALCLSFVRKLKSKTFWKSSLTGKFFIWLWKLTKRACNWVLGLAKKSWEWILGNVDYFKKYFDGRAYDKFPLTKKLYQMQRVFIITTLVVTVISLFTFVYSGGLMLLSIQVVITYWYIKGTRDLYDDINRGISDIQAEKRRSENTKTELITNVSHDLKTPLTSIISYVDLLSKEEGLSDSAKDYVAIISQKSERLNHMVSDLFDLSKSTSGNLSLDIETLDYKKLVEQTLADMKDNIDGSGMTIRTSFPAEPVMIRTDGKKLYRVFQNVIDNALKYSMKGTRVFVSVEVQDGKAIATVKNIAGYEIEFTEEEILQRFTRGDKSRSGDGSGLGLSIAESFTHSCGGEFKLELDGDLFKVMMTFDLID